MPRFFSALFTPPYRHLPQAVFAFFVACFLLHPASPLYTGQFADPDDYMRLNQAINWLQGQGWYDVSQPRMSPGAHTIIHWARLVDLPLALIALPFIKLFGVTGSVMLAALIVPPILFALLLMLAPALAKPLTGDDRANLAAVMVLFAPMVLFNYTPGRVDHHGWQILIAGFGLLALTRMTGEEDATLPAITASILFACGLWIGTEALPWLLLFIGLLALFAAWNGGKTLRNAAVFGVSFTLAASAVLPLALPPAEFSSRALSRFSMADVILAALTGGMFVIGGLWGYCTNSKILRLALFAALGFFATALFLAFVPDALIGPFADYDNFNATTALENIGEAQPLITAFQINPHWQTWVHALTFFAHFLFLPTLALLACLWHIVRGNGRAWFITGTYLLAAIMLTLFWQVRVGYFMELFTLAPITYLLWAWWDKIRFDFFGRERFAMEILAFLVLGPLPVLLLPALFEKTIFYPDLLLYPAARSDSACPLKPVAEFLNERYGNKTHTILTGMNEGPEILFRTKQQVVGGNFNVPGNPDVYAFFSGRDETNAQDILHKWQADLVLTCRHISPFYARLNHMQFGRTAFLHAEKDGKLHGVSSLDEPPVIEKLVNGNPPAWLKPVEIPDDPDYLLFETRDQGSGSGGQGQKQSQPRHLSPKSPEPRTPSPEPHA